MIGRLLAAWRVRQAKERAARDLVARLRAEPFPPPVFPDPPASVAQPAAAAVRQTAPSVDPLPRLWSYLWPPIPPPLPPRDQWTRRPAPPCDPAWRAAAALRPGCAVYPPRRQPGVVGRGR